MPANKREYDKAYKRRRRKDPAYAAKERAAARQRQRLMGPEEKERLKEYNRRYYLRRVFLERSIEQYIQNLRHEWAEGGFR